jgi:hypothetical protein
VRLIRAHVRPALPPLGRGSPTPLLGTPGATSPADRSVLKPGLMRRSRHHTATNTHTMSVSLDHSYTHTPSLLAGSQGDYQTLPDGDAFVGWGAEPDFSEYTPGALLLLDIDNFPSGQQMFTASFSAPVTSYRALRTPGRRSPPPARRYPWMPRQAGASPSTQAGTAPPTSPAGRSSQDPPRTTSPHRAPRLDPPGSRPPSRSLRHSVISRSGRLTAPVACWPPRLPSVAGVLSDLSGHPQAPLSGSSEIARMIKRASQHRPLPLHPNRGGLRECTSGTVGRELTWKM